MRHRIGTACTGLGNPDPVILDNKWSEIKVIDKAAEEIMAILIPEYFAKWSGCDFCIRHSDNAILLACGYEPAYFGESLFIITVHSDKSQCSIQTGRAFGYYGSGIRSRTKTYSEYKRMGSKFVRLMDQCNKILVAALERMAAIQGVE